MDIVFFVVLANKENACLTLAVECLVVLAVVSYLVEVLNCIFIDAHVIEILISKNEILCT